MGHLTGHVAWSRLLSVVVAITLVGGLAPEAGALASGWDPVFGAPRTVANLGASTRPFGVATGDFDGDGSLDVVVGRTTGHIAFVKGNGDGTFQSPTTFPWKQGFFNAWSFTSADLNGDGNLDVVWGANATSTGTNADGVSVTVNDGDVRVFFGNGNGTFVENSYFVSGVRHNAGSLLADIGTDAGSLTSGDMDGDGDPDIIAGAVDGSNSVIRLIRNHGAAFTVETLVSQPTNVAPGHPVYFPAVSTQNSPWGLATGDAEGDGDLDLWVGDRALYVYLFENDGAGRLTVRSDNSAVSGRPNVYLDHSSFRAAVGYTPSLGSGDLNGDGRADVVLGLHSGTQSPSSGVVHDGTLLVDVSRDGGHTGLGGVSDVGTMTRGVSVDDADGDGTLDVLASTYEGVVHRVRQLPPLDTDADGIQDYVDNAPEHANAARIDMNTDGLVTALDQLDNDFDTVLGNVEDPTTWQRTGDPADPDDDNDGVSDTTDTCPFVADAGQQDADSDTIGDACDPLDGRDDDGDGIADGPEPGEPLFKEHRAAKARWASGSTRFVLRIDALSRFFQNEFTQLQTDAAVLSPAEWAVKCWENYGAGDAADPCGSGEGTVEQALVLDGGRSTAVSLVVIPKQVWTDPPVVDWINDRNDNPLLEIGQHGTYHPNNIPHSDWADDPALNWLACETCGLTEEEVFQLLHVGHDTMLGHYENKWVAEAGATAASSKIDWSTSAHPMLSYAAPFNASDETARKAMAQLGFKSFSASRAEEDGTTKYGSAFTPDGLNRHETFDPWGMFHASADGQVNPPDDLIGDGDYSEADRSIYEGRLAARTEDGGLNTWLIEEVEWSGRSCNDLPRLTDCNGSSNREDNTVYLPRWEAWLHLLDYVRSYPGGVVLTLGEVALAQGYDNAITVPNPDQSDADADGVGDAIDGAAMEVSGTSAQQGSPATLSAVLRNGAADPIPGQTVGFSADVDGDGSDERFEAITSDEGLAEVTVTFHREPGEVSFSAAWDGGHGVTAAGAGRLVVSDASEPSDRCGGAPAAAGTDGDTSGSVCVDNAGSVTIAQASDGDLYLVADGDSDSILLYATPCADGYAGVQTADGTPQVVAGDSEPTAEDPDPDYNHPEDPMGGETDPSMCAPG